MAVSPAKRRVETLEYIQSMLEQLRAMAEAEGCDMLSFLIEMAHLEARDALNGEGTLSVSGQQRDSAA